mgnify:FL=1
MFENSSKLLKIFSLYAILIGYIKLTEIFKNNISTINNYSFNVAAYNLLNIIFYLLIIILIYLISLEKSNKSIETLFLFIPAIIFILSPFLSLFNIYVEENIIGNVLQTLMLNSSVYLFVGTSIICILIFRHIKTK